MQREQTKEREGGREGGREGRERERARKREREKEERELYKESRERNWCLLVLIQIVIAIGWWQYYFGDSGGIPGYLYRWPRS